MQPSSEPQRQRVLPPLPPVRPQTKTKWTVRLFKLVLLLGLIAMVALPVGLFVKTWIMGVSSEKGLQAAANGDHQQAIVYFTRAIDEAPRNADSYCARAGSYLELGDRNQAIADYRSCLEFTVDYNRRIEIGALLSELGQ